MSRVLRAVLCGALGIAGVCFSLFWFWSTHEPGESQVPVLPALLLLVSLALLGVFGYVTA